MSHTNSPYTPTILNTPDLNDTSFNSVLLGVPLNNLNNIPELPSNSEDSSTSLKKSYTLVSFFYY